MSVEKIYATDYNLWVRQTAKLLREHRWQNIDLENLLEEIEDLGKIERSGSSNHRFILNCPPIFTDLLPHF